MKKYVLVEIEYDVLVKEGQGWGEMEPSRLVRRALEDVGPLEDEGVRTADITAYVYPSKASDPYVWIDPPERSARILVRLS